MAALVIGLIRWVSDPSKCLLAFTGSAKEGLQVHDCQESNLGQQFIFVQDSEGPIRSAKYPNKCLNVPQIGNDIGKLLRMAECHEANTGDYHFVVPSGGTGLIQWAVRRELCVSISGLLSVWLHMCYDDMQFIVPQSNATQRGNNLAASPVMGLLRSLNDQTNCVSVIAGWAGNGQELQLSKCSEENSDSLFIIIPGGEAPIRWSTHPDKCLYVPEGKQQLMLWDCSDASSKDFLFMVPALGCGLIKWSEQPLLCLSISSEQRLELTLCNDHMKFIIPGATAQSCAITAAAPAVSLDFTGVHTGDLAALSPKGPSMAFVQLFEWRWDDIALECEDFLGPKGFTAVQISPPQEHIQKDNWWARYQPVSYQLVSRSGNEESFIEMVQRCKAVGVGIYADVVINHMAWGGWASGGSAAGIAGTVFSNRAFPPLYETVHFHHDSGNIYSNCDITDYGNKDNVQRCDLLGLADLCTSCTYVQERIASYLNRLIDIGVSGFRIDAAKHIDANELSSILARVNGRSFRYLEVIQGWGEAVLPNMYYHLGRVTEFRYGHEIGRNFLLGGKLQYFYTFGEQWAMMPSESAVVFIDNHDTQRSHAGSAKITYKTGSLYMLATIFMLAHPYGYPRIMSSYYFSDTEAGPTGQRVHSPGQLHCGNGMAYVCEHRWTAVANMVAWRKSAGNSGMSSWTSPGPDLASFCRGVTACIMFNLMPSSHWDFSVVVTMPPGDYCNIIQSDQPNCETIVVGVDGSVTARVGPMSAIAFHIGSRP